MKQWNILYSPSDTADSVEPFDLQTFVAILLQNRKLETKESIESFLHPVLENIELEKLGVKKKEIDAAAKLITKTKEEEKTIVIYGDYDVDGVCASAILWETLYGKYKKVVPYIPHRVEEGYGLSIAGIDNVLAKHPDTGLIITVDNGITATEAIQYAKEKGLHVIVTDHHTKGEQLPGADVIIHTDKVCGAGVAYAFAKAMDGKTIDEEKHLELVALATIADCMPLLAENRSLVKYGLQALSKTTRIGLLELLMDAKIDKNVLDVYHVGFMIAPRLNATGRLASAMDSLRLLCTGDVLRAKMLTKKLSGTNKERQELTSDLVNHAKALYANGDIKKILVAADTTYNQGVIGLIASKLTENYYRPSIVIAIGENGISKGSARSIKGVNIVQVLRSVSDHLVQVGGHEMAAGFTIKTDNIKKFTDAITASCEEIISDNHLQRTITADMELPFDCITYDTYKAVQQFSPFGIANPEPAFVTKHVTIKDIKMLGKEGKHLKFILEQDSIFFEALGFGFGTHFEGKIGDTIDVLYTLSFDTWNGKNKVVLRLKDIHAH